MTNDFTCIIFVDINKNRIKYMAAKYDLFLTPQPKDKQKVRYHARVVIYKSVSTQDIVYVSRTCGDI